MARRHSNRSHRRPGGGHRRDAALRTHGAGLLRLTARARAEIAGGRLEADSRPTLARCPACGEPVRGGDDYVRDRGDLYHAGCVLYRH